jgi:hypothetical protein
MFKKLTSLTVTAGLMLSLTLGASAMMMMHGIPKGGDGPVYTGTPELKVTSAFVHAGDESGHFSVAKALVAMVGQDMEQAEVTKLTKQYGEKAVASWIEVTNFSTDEAGQIAQSDGITMPDAPPDLDGHALASRLVKLGLSKNGTFYQGTLLDHLVSHKIHAGVMDAIDAKYGTAADGSYHKISNQAMYDLAQALGATTVRLAAFH